MKIDRVEIDNKFIHIYKNVESCKTEEQLKSCSNWVSMLCRTLNREDINFQYAVDKYSSLKLIINSKIEKLYGNDVTYLS